MSFFQTDSVLALPKSLEEKLKSFKQTLIKRSRLEWVLVALVTLLTGFLLFFCWDRLVLVGKGGRLFLFLLGLSGVLLLGPLRYYFRAWRYKTNRDLTHLIKKYAPRYGDRLLGVLELRRQDSDKSHFSPALREAALGQIAQEGESMDFKKSLPRDFRRPLLLSLIPLLLMTLVITVLSPKQSRNAAARYLFPMKEIPRYAVIRFQDLPSVLYVAHGEGTDYEVTLKDASQLPEIPALTVKAGRQATETVAYSDGGYKLFLPGVEKATQLTLQAGDAYARVTLRPVKRPTVEKITARQTLPTYLQIPERELNVDSSYLEVVKGSDLSLSLQASSPLTDVHVTPGMSATVTKKSAQLPSLLLEERKKIEIKVTDEYGITSALPTTLTIQPREDAAPSVSLSAPEKEIILLPHESLDLNLAAKDDFGVKELGIMWHPLSDENKVRIKRVEKGEPTDQQKRVPFIFNPEILKIYPNSYQLYAAATDYFPERGPVRSAPVTLHLLSLEGHAEHLRTQFTAFLDRLDGTYEKERALYIVNQRLAETDVTEIRTVENNSRLKTTVNGEKTQIKQLEKHVEASQKLLNDSLRNPQLARSIVKSLALLSERLSGLEKNNLPEIRNTLEAAFDNRFSNQYAQDQLAHAVSLQRTALDEFAEAIADARAANRSFEASTFVHRLSEIARSERQFSKSIWESIPESIGKTSEELDPALRERNRLFIERQADYRQKLRWIEDDLRNYAKRVGKEEYGELAEEIVSSHVYGDMGNVETSLQDNLGNISSLTALKCAKTIDSWVNKIGESADAGGSGSGGGNGGGGSQQERDTEFMLRMMEIIRTQQDLRGRTRALEQEKRFRENEE